MFISIFIIIFSINSANCLSFGSFEANAMLDWGNMQINCYGGFTITWDPPRTTGSITRYSGSWVVTDLNGSSSGNAIDFLHDWGDTYITRTLSDSLGYATGEAGTSSSQLYSSVGGSITHPEVTYWDPHYGSSGFGFAQRLGEGTISGSGQLEVIIDYFFNGTYLTGPDTQSVITNQAKLELNNMTVTAVLNSLGPTSGQLRAIIDVTNGSRFMIYVEEFSSGSSSSINETPEPATMLLLGSGLLGLAGYGRKKFFKK